MIQWVRIVKDGRCMKKIFITLFAVLIFCMRASAFQDGYYLSGIGIKMKLENDTIKVINIIKNAPAQKAGLKEGDIILEVDGWEAKDLNKANEKIRGESGTVVKLLIKRSEETMPFNITREKFYVSDYVEIYEGAKAYFDSKYLKYQNGIYYFWIKELYGAWGQNKNYGHKDYVFSRVYIAIDLKNEKIATIQTVRYDKSGKPFYNSDNYDYEAEYQRIIPNTAGYMMFNIIKILNTKLEKEGYATDEQKEKNINGLML